MGFSLKKAWKKVSKPINKAVKKISKPVSKVFKPIGLDDEFNDLVDAHSKIVDGTYIEEGYEKNKKGIKGTLGSVARGTAAYYTFGGSEALGIGDMISGAGGDRGFGKFGNLAGSIGSAASVNNDFKLDTKSFDFGDSFNLDLDAGKFNDYDFDFKGLDFSDFNMPKVSLPIRPPFG